MSHWSPDEARKRVRERCANIPAATIRELAKTHDQEFWDLSERAALASTMADEYARCADEAEGRG